MTTEQQGTGAVEVQPEPTQAESTVGPTAGGSTAAESASAASAASAWWRAAPRVAPALPETRPAEAPPDPWTAFARTPEHGPGRVRRALRAVGRALIHEYALVSYAGLLLAVVMTWPTLRYPLHTLPQDLANPAQQAWQLAWSGHILRTQPGALWEANAFYPHRYSLAFGESLLGYAPFGMLGSGPEAAVLRYNLLFVAAHALLFIGGYALVRQLGAGRTGAAVAAVAFAYAPWRLAQEDQLAALSVGAIPLALAMLARGHGWSLRHGLRLGRRHAGWAFAGWLVAAWQLSLNRSTGLVFAYVLAVVLLIGLIAMVVRRIRRRPVRHSWPLFCADLTGIVAVSAVGTLLALPYLRIVRFYPNAVVSETELRFLSAPLRGLLIAPAESRVWGAAHALPRTSLGWPPEMTLLPGFVLYGLALVGLLVSIWTIWQRLLLLAGTVLSALLATGTGFYGGRYTYLPLVDHLPGWRVIRVPGSLILWTTLLLGVLAAGAVAELVRRTEQLTAHRVPPWPGPWLRLATFLPLCLVTVEGLNATPHPVVPAQPTVMRTDPGPVLVLPTGALDDPVAALWSTTRFAKLANGSAPFVPPQQAQLRAVSATFPDAGSISWLRQRGISTVVLLRDKVAGTPWERAGDLPVDTLGIRREDVDNTVVFRL